MARVMLVDDALFMRATMKKVLTGAGHEVIGEAADGEEAVALYGKVSPDIVLMDITMPKMDGVAALNAIKSEHPEAVVVMCTALGQENMVKDALSAGAKDYLIKPVNPEKLLQTIARILG